MSKCIKTEMFEKNLKRCLKCVEFHKCPVVKAVGEGCVVFKELKSSEKRTHGK